MSGRAPVVAPIDDALAVVEDGAVVGIGGAVTAGHPMALVRGLIRRGVKDLTVVAPVGGIEVDLLIAAGCVSKVMGSYVGIEVVASVGPVFRRAVEREQVEVIDLDEAHCVQGLRAAGQQLPFLPWRGGVGTSFPQLNPALVEFDDPVRGQPLLAVPAIELDVALIYAETADEFGNAQVVGTGHMDALLGAAARTVVLQADRIVSNEAIRRNPVQTTYWRDTTVVRAPFGTHPYSNAWMIADDRHLRDFVRAAKEDELDAYLRRHVHDAGDEAGYLEAIGIRRLTELMI